MAVLDFLKGLFSSKDEVTQGDVLSEFRKQYPVYASAPDDKLATRLAEKFPDEYGFLSKFDAKAPVSPEITPRTLRDEQFYARFPELGQKDALQTLASIKERFPVYKDVPDDKLARALEKKFPDRSEFRGISSRIPAPPAPAPGPGLPGFKQPELKTDLTPGTETYRKTTGSALEPSSKFQEEDASNIGRETITYLKNLPSAAENTLLKGVLKIPEDGAPDIPVFPGFSIPGAPVARMAKDAVLAGSLELAGFYKGVTGLDMQIDPASLAAIEERKVDPKIAMTAGEIVGGLAMLSGVSSVLKAERAGGKIAALFYRNPTVARYLAPATADAISFGVTGAIHEGISQIAKGKLDLLRLGKIAAQDTFFGAGLGAVARGLPGAKESFGPSLARYVPDDLFRVMGASAYGFGTALMKGQTIMDATINSAIMGLFVAGSSKGLTRSQKLGAFNAARRNVTSVAEEAARTKGYTETEVSAISRQTGQAFDAFVAKNGGPEGMKLKDFERGAKEVRSKIDEIIAPKKAEAPPKPAEIETKPAPGETPAPIVETPPAPIAPIPAGGEPARPPATSPRPTFGVPEGPKQTTIFGTEEPVTGKAKPAPAGQPGLFSGQAQPTFEVPSSAIQNAPPAAPPEDVRIQQALFGPETAPGAPETPPPPVVPETTPQPTAPAQGGPVATPPGKAKQPYQLPGAAREVVEAALKEGKRVPARVLDEHPDLRLAHAKRDARGLPDLPPDAIVARIDVGADKPVNVTHAEVLAEAKAIYKQEKESFKITTSDPIRDLIFKHKVKPSGDLGGEWNDLPLHAKDAEHGWTADQLAEYINESPRSFGLDPGQEVSASDIYQRAQKRAAGTPPKLDYERALRNIEYFAQEGVGQGQKVVGGEDFFEKAGSRRVPSGEAAVGSQTIDTFEQIETPATTKARQEFKLGEKALAIVKKYAERVGEKYLPRGAVGVFHPATNNIRVNSLNNLSTTAHEVTHYLDHRFGIIDPLMEVKAISKAGNPIYNSKWRQVRKRLTDIYLEYYPGAQGDHKLVKRLREGLAVFFQKYAETPNAVRQKYPDLVRAFLGIDPATLKPLESKGELHKPIYNEFVDDLHSIIAEYQALDPLQKIGARVTSKFQQAEIRDSYLNFWDKVLRETVDNIYPIEKLAREAGVQRTAADPSLWARQYNNSTSIVLQNIRGKSGFWIYSKGQFRKVSKENIRDLVDTLQKKGLVDDFGKWLVSRRQTFAYQELDILHQRAIQAATELQKIREMKAEAGGEVVVMGRQEIAALKKTIEDYKRLKGILKADGFDRKVAEAAYKENAEVFAPYAELFDRFTKANLDMLVDPEVGLITPKQYAEMATREGYASFKRDIYDEILGGGEEPVQRGGAPANKPSSTISRRGSNLTILNPLYSLIADHAEIVRKSLRQTVYNKVARLAGQFPSLFQQLELKPHVDKETGVISYPQEKDPNVLMARNAAGQRVPYLTSREVKSILDEVLDFQNVHILERGLRAANRWFTKGTTAYYPLFAPTNFLIDQISASAQTRNKYVPIYDSLAQVAKALLQHGSVEAEYFQEYMALGGERQAFVNWQDRGPSELFEIITRERHSLGKVADGIERGLNILALPSSASEIATRAAEYIKSRKKGNAQVVALEDAGRVSVPFHHMGRFGGSVAAKGGKLTVGQTFVKSIPFMNPGIQVIAQYVRTMNQADTQNRALFVTLAMIAAAASSSFYMMKKATPEQKKLYMDLESGELANYIWLPSTDGKKLIRVRAPEQMIMPAVLLNMAMWDVVGKANYNVGDYVSAATAFLPDQMDATNPRRMFLSSIPQVVKPLINVLYNKKDWPRVRPLVSLGLENKEPRFQFNNNTSAFAKWLGDKLNLSPIKIDYLVEGYFGRATKPLRGQAINNPFVREWYFTAGRNLQDYYEQRTVSNQLWNSYRGSERQFTQKEIAQINDQQAQVRYIDRLLGMYRQFERQKGVPEEVQRQSLQQLRDQILDEVSKFRQGVKVK